MRSVEKVLEIIIFIGIKMGIGFVQKHVKTIHNSEVSNMIYEWPLKNPNHKPFSSQKVTTKFLLANKRAFVLNEMRTGKTLSVLWATDILFRHNKIKKVLIVAPLTILKLVWAKEIFCNFPHLSYAIAHGTHEKRLQGINSNANFIIINHDGIKTVYNELIEAKFNLLVIDEVTAYKNATSDRSKLMRRIADTIPAVWSLSGNVTPNGPTEAFSPARITVPNNPYLPKYYTKFRDFVEYQVSPFIWVPKPGAKDVVHRVLQPSIRFTREESFDIPTMTHRVIELELSAEQNHAYNEVRDKLYYEYDKGEITIANAGVKMLKLLQISAGAVKDDNGNVLYLDDKPKVDYILNVFENDAGRGKLVVVSAFRASVERLTKTFKEKKIKSELIYGQIDLNKRTAIVNDFQTGDLQILVVQPQAVSHGICLDATNLVIWHSLVASGETFGQMTDRIISASQTKKQFVEYLIASKADKNVYDILSGKKDFSSAVLNLFKERVL